MAVYGCEYAQQLQERIEQFSTALARCSHVIAVAVREIWNINSALLFAL